MAERAKFKQIADHLRDAIAANTIAGGGQLPGEEALAEQFDTSTATARKAIAVLRREGLVYTRRGVGAFVRDWKPILRDANRRLSAEQWGSGKAIWDVDLGDRKPDVRITVETTADVPAVAASALGVSHCVVRDRLYLVDGRPIQIATSYLDADLVAGTQVERKDTGEGGTYARLAELGCKPTWFREQVRARLPFEDEAKRLRIPEAEPIVEIVRQAMAEDGRIVEVNVMVLVGDAYVLQYVFHS